MILITTGSLIAMTRLNGTCSRITGWVIQWRAVPVEDEAAGICSRDLVQLSQNLEIILSPGEKGYDFLVVDRNQREADRRLYGGNTYQLYVADLYNNPPPGLTNITITGGGGCSVINAVTTVPLPSSNIAGAYRMSFADRYRY